MEIISIFIVILVVILSFFVGRKTVKHREQLSYEKELAELDKLNERIDNLKQLSESHYSQVEHEKSLIQSLRDEYEEKRQLNKQYELDYKSKINTLNEYYKVLENQKEEELKEFINKIQEEKEKVKFELDSLKSTRAATVEAFRKEQQIKENLDAYRLNISDQDKRDIAVLDSIKLQLSKPRILSMLIWQTFYQPIAKQKFSVILGSDKICGIYKIEDTVSGEVYIGQAVNCRKRWLDHCKAGIGIDTPQGNKLYNAMIRDGLYNFTFSLLEACSKEELDEKEKYYIAMYNSVNFGLNSTIGNSKE